jgi:nucleoside-diphosphate kinase
MTAEPKMQFTLALIKSRALEQGHGDNIRHAMAQMPGVSVVAEIYAGTDEKAFCALYEEHEGRAYYDGLIDSVTKGEAGSAQVFVLKGHDCISKWRAKLGATNPSSAAEGTIRYKFGLNMPHNAGHGSDSPESAKREIAIFFPHLDTSEMAMTPPPEPVVEVAEPANDVTHEEAA